METVIYQEKDRIIENLKSKRDTLKYESSIIDVPISEFDTNFNIGNIRLLLGKAYLYIYRTDITNKEYTHAKVQIGRIKLDEDCNPTDFIKDREDVLISDTFDFLSGINFFSKIRNTFNVPNLGEASRRDAQRIALEENRAASEKQSKIDEIKLLEAKNRLNNKPRKKIEITDDEVVASVAQGEIVFLGEKSEKRYLETLSAGPCIIITGHNQEGKTVMTHIDALTNEQSVLQELLRYTKNEIHVFGGDNSSISQLVSIKEVLDSHNVDVVEWDILNSVKSIIIDHNTGEIFDVLNSKNRSNATQQNASDMFARSMQGKKPATRMIY